VRKNQSYLDSEDILKCRRRAYPVAMDVSARPSEHTL